MTRFSPPLTPAEQAALKTACAELDAERLDRIENASYLEHKKRRSVFRISVTNKYFMSRSRDYIERAAAYHLAAALLAGQMAERL